MNAELKGCHWPELDEPFITALRHVVKFVLDTYHPIGIVVGGSILRGQGDANSDLDVYVVHREQWRQRVQRIINGVPVEIFVNPPAQVRRYFVDERKAGRPITAHLLTTGFVVLDQDRTLEQLRTEAATALVQRPDLPPMTLQTQRYLAVDLLDNVADVAERTPDVATLMLDQAMQRMIVYAYLAANHNLPRLKETLDRLDEVSPALQQLARRYYAESSFGEKYAAALGFAQRALGVTSFYEWASEREIVDVS